MPRALITGGAGFIGRRLVRRLIDGGWTVRVLDDLSTGIDAFPAGSAVELRRGDIRDVDVVAAAFDGFQADCVVHLAALHQVVVCAREPRRALDVNVIGAQTVLDAAERAGVRRVLLASTGAVYDWIDGPLAETAAVLPRDSYALSKAANERQLAIWAERTGGEGRIARIFNVIGTGDANAHLLPDLLGRLAAHKGGTGGDPLPLALGNRDSRRDYLGVEDVAEGLAAMMDCETGEPVEAFNLCGGRDLRVSEIAEMAAAAANIPIRLTHDPALARAFDRPSQLGDPAKSWRRLGWRAKTPIPEVVAEMVAADPRFSAAAR